MGASHFCGQKRHKTRHKEAYSNEAKDGRGIYNKGGQGMKGTRETYVTRMNNGCSVKP